jgi:rhodanese-related sulfurtransferase
MGFFSRFRQPSVNAAEAIELVSGGATLLDVRENNEWNAGHAPGAVHIPLSQVPAQAARRLPKGRQVIVVCRSGSRASSAAATLRSAGIEAVNLKGGMRAWESAGGRLVGKGNRPGVVA